MGEIRECKFIVLTGGPGAGKTAVMGAARQIFARDVLILPESASIVYSGGFPRFNTPTSIKSAQRAIARVQEELELYATEEGTSPIALCDRGIVDGAAYWPDGYGCFYSAIGMDKNKVFSRYSTVIHLKTPTLALGYNHDNPMRIETPEQAEAIDKRIEAAWEGHPNRFIVPATESFTEKLEHVTELIKNVMPAYFVAPANNISSSSITLQ